MKHNNICIVPLMTAAYIGGNESNKHTNKNLKTGHWYCW